MAMDRFHIGKKDCPLEIIETEVEMAEFLSVGVSMITREGELLISRSGGSICPNVCSCLSLSIWCHQNKNLSNQTS